MRISRLAFVVAAFLLTVHGLAFAQSANTGAIAGVVKDATGAVLPGVTVEAASPALIEKVRSVVSDSNGNYKIVDLRPGSYTVTFSLTGFSTVRREGIELTTGVTANVNGDLKVGSLEETITVTGASPVVDIQNVRSQTVISQQVLDSVPTAKTAAGFAALTLGVNLVSSQQDVGGNKGDAVAALAVHGGRGNDGRFKIDGLGFNNNSGDGGGVNKIYLANVAAMQETTLETGGMTAEADTGGVQVNYVPKDGGNMFKYYVTGNFANGGMQGANLNDEHRARGLLTASSINKIYDLGGGFGGPILKDKLWFYTAHRIWGTQEFQPGAYFNKTQNTLFYTPDLNRPAFTDTYDRDHSGRLTWQITPTNKLSYHESYQNNCFCFLSVSSTSAPEATTSLHFEPLWLTQVTWSHPASNRMLLDAGTGYVFNAKKTALAPGVTKDSISISDTGLGITYGAFATGGSTAYNINPRGQEGNQMNGRAALSYITGSHAFKGGFTFYKGWDHQDRYVNNYLSYTFRTTAGVTTPQSITQWAMPVLTDNQVLGLGYYVQDQWTVRKLTLSGGIRIDQFNGHAPAVDLAPSRFLPQRHFDAVNDAPDWKDWSPRIGAAFDVFGNGKTAVKASLGRYVQAMGVGFTEQVNPQLSLVLSAARTWNDAFFPAGDPRRGNFVPDCDLTNFAANAECAALNNSRFGTVNLTRRFADDVTRGWGARPYNWQSSLQWQQELRPGMALNVGYFRTWFGNVTVTDNLLVAPANYDQYCVTAPTNPLLPDSGKQLCGLYDLNPTKFGQVDNLVTQGERFGDFTNVFNGVDIGMNARFGAGGVLNGGVAVGRTVTNNCAVVDSPQDGRAGFCEVTPPWFDAGTQFKFNTIYPLPWGISTSATFQNLPGAAVSASNSYLSSQLVGLGRPLSSGATAAVTVPVLKPQTLFEDRLTQVDLRFSKSVRISGARLQGMFDVYNLFNAGTILGVNGTYGASWRRPTAILGPRMFKVGGVFDF